MIARHWTGLAYHDRADDYERFLRTRTFPEIKAIAGFLGGSILRAEKDDGIAFRVITEWVSLEAVRGFAGDEVEQAVIPEDVLEMLARYDRSVTHYEVRHRVGEGPQGR